MCQSDAAVGLKGATWPRDYSWGGKACRVTDSTCRQTFQAETNGADVSKALLPKERISPQCVLKALLSTQQLI